ncbi:MAG: dTMP kinase [Bacillota bacterium]
MSCKKRGFFVTFEGCEGAGKTTQLKLLEEKLKERGYKLEITREPGGSRIGNTIRKILLNPENKFLDSKAEILLYAADRAQDVQENIRPALEEGKIVLADRFVASNLAYQGYGRGMDLEMIVAINKWVIEDCQPDLTIILDVDVETGLKRARDYSGTEDRLEQEEIDFHRRVRAGYLKLAADENDRFVRVDANCGVEKLSKKIFALVEKRLLS